MPYKPRRERKRAAGGPAEMPHHGAPHMIIVMGLGPKKKRKRGGHVEGEAARHHLGRRARGGKALDARQDANDPDGIDRVSEGSGTDERAVAVRRHGGRAEGEHGLGRGTHKFRTPSGSVSANARRKAEHEGDSMPGGRFPIRNVSDLHNAEHDFGRAHDKPAVRRWIDKKAKQLGEPPMGGKVGK